MREKWLKVILRKMDRPPADHTHVCSKHFLASDYSGSLKMKRLLITAVPSVFPKHLRFMQQPAKKSRMSSSISETGMKRRLNTAAPSATPTQPPTKKPMMSPSITQSEIKLVLDTSVHSVTPTHPRSLQTPENKSRMSSSVTESEIKLVLDTSVHSVTPTTPRSTQQFAKKSRMSSSVTENEIKLLLDTAIHSVTPTHPRLIPPSAMKSRMSSSIIKTEAFVQNQRNDDSENTGTIQDDHNYVHSDISSKTFSLTEQKDALREKKDFSKQISDDTPQVDESFHKAPKQFRNVAVQVDALKQKRSAETLKLKMKYDNLFSKMQELQNELEIQKEVNDDEDIQAFKLMLHGAATGDKLAISILDQVKNYSAKKPSWSDTTMQNCVLWRNYSCKGYNFPIINGLFKLPSGMTLNKLDCT